jgi:hypothetical protein
LNFSSVALVETCIIQQTKEKNQQKDVEVLSVHQKKKDP